MQIDKHTKVKEKLDELIDAEIEAFKFFKSSR
jgi:formiminotetrahydrofolate cyclodeaminase